VLALGLYSRASKDLMLQDIRVAEATQNLTVAFDTYKDSECVLLREQEKQRAFELKLGRWRNIFVANGLGSYSSSSVILKSLIIFA
jgi:hypothetical protein